MNSGQQHLWKASIERLEDIKNREKNEKKKNMPQPTLLKHFPNNKRNCYIHL